MTIDTSEHGSWGVLEKLFGVNDGFCITDCGQAKKEHYRLATVEDLK